MFEDQEGDQCSSCIILKCFSWLELKKVQMVNERKNDTLLNYAISQHNQTPLNVVSKENVYALPLLRLFLVEREVGEIENASEDRGGVQVNGDNVVEIQSYTAPWRSKLHFLNMSKSSSSSQLDVMGEE